MIILLLLLAFGLYGYYRGFIHATLCIGAYLLSCVLAFLFMGAVSEGIKGNESLYNMMLYYTEGSEYVGSVDLSKTPISEVSGEVLSELVSNPSLPYPMGRAIEKNIAREAFSAQGVITLGDYFNQTIVCMFINILSFLMVFLAVRLILMLVLNTLQYSREFPMLRHSDRLIAGGFGLVRGLLAMFIVMMLLPILLTVLPFDFISDLVEGSFFCPFFYHSNFLLGLIPGV